jgi:cytoskeletal protein RodZ
MQEEKNNNKYTADDIRKYLDGQLSDQAMQALEKAALEDPFLADAIEGFEESRKHAVSFESGIADLKVKLSERIGERKRKTGIWIQLSKWQVAASLILIIGLAVFMVTYVNKKPGISQTIPVPDSTTVAIKKPTEENPRKSDSMTFNEQAIVSAKSPNEGKDLTFKKAKTTTKKETGEHAFSDESSSARNAGNALATVPSKVVADTLQKTEKFEVLAKKDVTTPLAATSNKNIMEEGFSENDIRQMRNLSGNYIKGIVTNEKGLPIPFAEVNLKGTNRRVYTDTAGFFKLYMKDPRLAALVFVQPSGSESVSAELKPDSNVTNTIQMGPSTAVLNRAILLKYDRPPSIVGWDAFYSFIDSNKKINNADSLLKGEEVISFMLHPDGKLSSFKVKTSISPAHDAEILRLIPMAPALKSREKKKQKCQLHIWFK